MRFAASVLDSLSSLLPPPNYMPMRQLPDNDEDVELRLLTADGSPRASNRSSSGRPRDAGAAPRRSLMQVPSLTPTTEPPTTSHDFLQWLQHCVPSAFVKRKETSARSIIVGKPDAAFARNVTRNQKYHAASFLPQVIVEQFKTFSNLYFLLVALSQLIPALKVSLSCNRTSFPFLISRAQVGFLFTYVAPLIFVLTITVVKEGYDDFQRYKRDAAGETLQV